MGLFGGGGGTANTTTTTTVSPAQNVTDMLEQIAGYAENINPGSYIQRQHAGFNQIEEDALSALEQSSALKYMGNLLAPMIGEGTQGLAAVGRVAEEMAKGQIGPSTQGALSMASGLLSNSLTQQMAGQTQGAVNEAAANLGSANAAASAQGDIANQNAISGLNAWNQAAKAGAKSQGEYATSLQQGINMGSKIAQQMIEEAEGGVKDLGKANQNLLQAGEARQKEQQAEYDTDWENAMGEQLFPWEHADNMLNTLNKISRMAGYTKTTNSEHPVKGSSGLMGLGRDAMGLASLAKGAMSIMALI